MAARSPIIINNKGLEISLPLGKIDIRKHYFAALLCRDESTDDQWVGLLLEDISYHGGRYVRCHPHELVLLGADTVRGQPVQKLIIERMEPGIPRLPSGNYDAYFKWSVKWIRRFKRRLKGLDVSSIFRISPTFRIERDNRFPGWATLKRQSRGITCCLLSLFLSFVLFLFFTVILAVR